MIEKYQNVSGRLALITGSAGFLGRHFVARLEHEGFSVNTVDLVDMERRSTGQHFVGDIRQVLPELHSQYDVAIHLAATVDGRETIDGDPLRLASNLSLDVSFFEFARRTRPSRSIYMSSPAAYPVRLQTGKDGEALGETEIDFETGQVGVPDQTYGWSKLTGEFLARVAHLNHQLNFSVYRPFSVYGPGQSDRYPVTAICNRAIRREDPLVVWGAGDQSRDFVFVDDVVDVVVSTFSRLDALSPMNICSGVPTTFDRLAELAARIVGYQPKIGHLPHKPRGVYRRYGSPVRLNQWCHLGTTLELGLTRLINNMQESGEW